MDNFYNNNKEKYFQLFGILFMIEKKNNMIMLKYNYDPQLSHSFIISSIPGNEMNLIFENLVLP
jgi:hypothetical protein